MAKREMSIILKSLGTDGIKLALKRHLNLMLNHEAVIFDVENLGLRRLPEVFRVKSERQYEGHYFLVKYDINPDHDLIIKKQARADGDVIKCFSCLIDDGWRPPCKVAGAEACDFGEIRNPNYEKTARRLHGFRFY